jgi:hypothetical protein
VLLDEQFYISRLQVRIWREFVWVLSQNKSSVECDSGRWRGGRWCGCIETGSARFASGRPRCSYVSFRQSVPSSFVSTLIARCCCCLKDYLCGDTEGQRDQIEQGTIRFSCLRSKSKPLIAVECRNATRCEEAAESRRRLDSLVAAACFGTTIGVLSFFVTLFVFTAHDVRCCSPRRRNCFARSRRSIACRSVCCRRSTSPR